MNGTGSSDLPVWVQDWFDGLEATDLASLASDSQSVALFSADMIVGFCDTGNLASPRVDALTGPVVDLFQRSFALGVREFVLLQDTHSASTPEFRAWPVHCVEGTVESQTIPELNALPFQGLFTVIEKNSLGPGHGTRFNRWLDEHPAITTAIVVGDCTDLCTYQLAMHLRLRANALNLDQFEVIIPADAVDTYDLPDGGAGGAFVHPGDFFHQVFLYHLALNGIRVVRSLT